MRVFGWSVLGLMTVALCAEGQNGGQPPVRENLDMVLRGWEKAMTDMKSFAVEIERTNSDRVLSTKDVFKGHAMFMKALTKDDGCRARLELYKDGSPTVFEKYICTGTFLYEYAAIMKKVRIHDMPRNQQGAQQESFLSFLFGMGAEQAKARYDMELKFPDPAKDTTGKYYRYIQVKPKLARDKSDFTEARLSLWRANNLPAQIWYHQANGNEITWNFSKPQVDVQIPLAYFQRDLPKGWTEERVPSSNVQGTPTIRNKAQ